MQTLDQLKYRAEKHGLMIRKIRGGDFMIVDAATNAVVSYPAELPIEAVEEYLDDRDKADDVQETD